MEERPPSLTLHNCWGSHKSYSADYEGAVDKTALKSQHPVMVKQLSGTQLQCRPYGVHIYRQVAGYIQVLNWP